MTIKLKAQELILANQTCKSLLKKSFSAKTLFKLIHLSKQLNNIEQIFNETQNATINKYAKRDEKGEIITETLNDNQIYIPILPEFQEQCNKEITEALAQNFDINYSPIKIEELEEEKITGEELMALYPFISNEEDFI